MSHGYTIDESRNLLVVRFRGDIAYAEEMAAVNEAFADPRIKPNMRVLVDRSEARMISTAEEAKTHAEFISRSAGVPGAPTVANVVSRDADYGTIRIFEALLDDKLANTFRLFRSMEEACLWLDLDLATVDWPELK
jgi:hypothetical protein